MVCHDEESLQNNNINLFHGENNIFMRAAADAISIAADQDNDSLPDLESLPDLIFPDDGNPAEEEQEDNNDFDSRDYLRNFMISQEYRDEQMEEIRLLREVEYSFDGSFRLFQLPRDYDQQQRLEAESSQSNLRHIDRRSGVLSRTIYETMSSNIF